MSSVISVPACRLAVPPLPLSYNKHIGIMTARHPQAPRVAHAEQIIESNLPFRLIALQEGWTASPISLPDHTSKAASVNAVYTSLAVFGAAHTNVVQGRTTLT
jgi:hypothetical protein